MSRRTDKVASLLQHEVGDFIHRLEMPALTTISKVEVTPDLKWSKIWITILGNEAKQTEVIKILMRSSRDLQKNLKSKMTMKFVPRVKFEVDHGEEYAAKINELLRKAQQDE